MTLGRSEWVSLVGRVESVPVEGVGVLDGGDEVSVGLDQQTDEELELVVGADAQVGVGLVSDPTLTRGSQSAWSRARAENVCHYIPRFWVNQTGRLGDVGFRPACGVDTDSGENSGLEGAGAGDDVDGPFAGGEGDSPYPVEFS